MKYSLIKTLILSKIYLFIISLSFALILFPFWVKSIIFPKAPSCWLLCFPLKNIDGPFPVKISGRISPLSPPIIKGEKPEALCSSGYGWPTGNALGNRILDSLFIVGEKV